MSGAEAQPGLAAVRRSGLFRQGEGQPSRGVPRRDRPSPHRDPQPLRLPPPRVWPSVINYALSRGSGGSRRPEKLMAPPPQRPDTSPCPGCPRRRSSWPRSAPIGPSRTPCSGSLTCSSGKRSAGPFSDPRHFREDNGPTNIAVLRRRALAPIRPEPSKASLSMKLQRAGWDDAFRPSIPKRIAEA